jgi:protein-L-isoaspartate(D-aspartate) O-methyltransferase
MVEVIGIQVDLASEELGKAALDERVLAAMRKVPLAMGGSGVWRS